MPEIQFFQTRMGQRFYESTMPELVQQLTRLNDLLERIAVVPDKQVEGADAEVAAASKLRTAVR